MRYVILCTLVTTVLIASACRRSNSKEAVRQAIQKHLDQQPGLILGNMNMELDAVKFSGDTAVADVRYVSKQVQNTSVVVRYQLHKSQDTEGGAGGWIVQSSSMLSMSGTPSGTSPHDSGSGNPAGEPQPRDQPAVLAPQPSH